MSHDPATRLEKRHGFSRNWENVSAEVMVRRLQELYDEEEDDETVKAESNPPSPYISIVGPTTINHNWGSVSSEEMERRLHEMTRRRRKNRSHYETSPHERRQHIWVLTNMMHAALVRANTRATQDAREAV